MRGTKISHRNRRDRPAAKGPGHEPVSSWVAFPAGLILAALLVLFARRYRLRGQRRIYANGLVIAASIYVAAGFLNGDPRVWGVELIGLLFFTGMAALGILQAPGWLAAGWLLHIGWDAARSLGGPEVMPTWYGVACLSFDLVIAVAIVYGRDDRTVRA